MLHNGVKSGQQSPPRSNNGSPGSEGVLSRHLTIIDHLEQKKKALLDTLVFILHEICGYRV